MRRAPRRLGINGLQPKGHPASQWTAKRPESSHTHTHPKPRACEEPGSGWELGTREQRAVSTWAGWTRLEARVRVPVLAPRRQMHHTRAAKLEWIAGAGFPLLGDGGVKRPTGKRPGSVDDGRERSIQHVRVQLSRQALQRRLSARRQNTEGAESLSRGLAVDVDGMDGGTREYSSSAAGMG